MRAVGLNHGDHKTRQIRRVRVRRDRRPSVICVMAADSLPSSWRSGKVAGRIGLGIAPGGGDTATDIQFRSRHGAEGINKTERSSHEIHDVYD